jgi:hypothetical protein
MYEYVVISYGGSEINEIDVKKIRISRFWTQVIMDD